jgi:hypothetical protein
MAKNLSGYLNLFLVLQIFINQIYADSFQYNVYNNHGAVGLINTPTARFYDEGVHGVTIYDGTPDQKITLSSSPYDWLEASFFYTNIQGFPYPGFEYQDYKDKGFNVKFRIKEEDHLPALAIGLSDFAGTGLYSSEYIVSSYGINNFDIHFGLGWGRLNGSSNKLKNPFSYIHDSFNKRPKGTGGLGGEFNLSKFFSGEAASPFYGIAYSLTPKTIIKIEKDTTKLNGRRLNYEERKSDYSIGVDYSINDNFSIGASFERGNFVSIKFIYKNNPLQSGNDYKYKEPDIDEEASKYNKLVQNLEKNGIGVNKVIESGNSIGIELTQFVHKDLKLVEQIISQSSRKAGLKKNIKKDIKIANLKAVNEIDDSFKKNSNIIYERQPARSFNTSTGFRFRPFFASREEFFKGALLVENNSELVIKDNLFFNTNIKYNIANNFEDLRFPPVDTYPAQVRSDVKQYLKRMDGGILIGRAQLDYYLTPLIDHHFMITGGILEDMFSGVGMEYLYFKEDTNYSFGIELFKVKKRDYEWKFGHLDYENTTLTANFYYRNYGALPFDMKISAGEYLAGDVGSTIEFSRTFRGGLRFGAFATFTDVSKEQFGEGSFDKGIFFNIPIYGNLINYTWKPLTKDPGARLLRKNNLHDLLVRFRPLN